MKLTLRGYGSLTILAGLLGCSSGQDSTVMDHGGETSDDSAQVSGEGADVTIGEVREAISFSDLTDRRGVRGIRCTSRSVILGAVYYVNSPSNKVGFYYCAGDVSGNVAGFVKINTGVGGSGATGPAGATGPQGAKGATGAQGAAGPQGSSVTGPQGPQGAQGAQGPSGGGAGGGAGATGAQGAQGAVGPQGAKGANGATGAQGAQGANGSGTGPQGAAGAQGPQGAKGAQGAAGVQGPQGAAGSGTGPQGAPGAAGPQGAKGANGAQGAAGAQGPQGANGAPGAAGAAGPQGAKGADGAQGAAGAQGGVGPNGAKAFVTSSAPSAPTAACPNGQVTIEVGTDTNGNGVFDRPAEVTGTVVTCNTGSASQPSSVCGNGIIENTGFGGVDEVCDTNGSAADVLPTGTAAGSTCSADCKSIVPPPVTGPLPNPACVACTNSQCGDLVAACNTEDNSASSPSGACNSVLACLHVSFSDLPATCAKTDTAACYCGTGAGGAVDIASCLGGTSNGVCKDVIRQQSGCIGSSNEAQCILSRQNDTDFGYGDASQIVNCQRSNCFAECGLDP